MAIKATILKASVQVSNLDDNIYADHQLTLALHPSETDERLMTRLLVYALNYREDPDCTALNFGKDMFDPDEPCMWQKDYAEAIVHWIDVGQPEARRVLQAAGRARKVSVYAFGSNNAAWWSSIADQVSKAKHLEVWSIPRTEAEALGTLAGKTMSIQVTIQDGVVYVEADGQTVEVTLERLNA